MNERTIIKSSTILTLILLGVLTSACTRDNTLKVAFDGSECVLRGPSELETGAHLIDVQNTSETRGWMRICWTMDDYTWQDILDHDFTDDEDVDDDVEWPAWCLGRPTSTVASADEDSIVYEYKFRNEGNYFILWEQKDPKAAWRCGPLSVTEPET